MLCEDCYMDALSPVRTCDPWAVHSAKTFEAQSSGQPALNDIQCRILAILKETGGLERHELVKQLGGRLSDADLERITDCAAQHQASILTTEKDLMNLGIEEGRLIGQILKEAYDAQMEARFASREELLDWLRREFCRRGDTPPPGDA